MTVDSVETSARAQVGISRRTPRPAPRRRGKAKPPPWRMTAVTAGAFALLLAPSGFGVVSQTISSLFGLG